MATKMKSFRLDEWTAKTIERTASEMGVSQANVISLAVEAFACYGIDTALNDAGYKDGSAAAYSTLIELSGRDGSIRYEIRSQIEACAPREPDEMAEPSDAELIAAYIAAYPLAGVAEIVSGLKEFGIDVGEETVREFMGSRSEAS